MFLLFHSSKNPEEAELEDILNSVVSDSYCLSRKFGGKAVGWLMHQIFNLKGWWFISIVSAPFFIIPFGFCLVYSCSGGGGEGGMVCG